MPTITPFLWFDNQAEEAIAFYRSVFKNVKGGPQLKVGETPTSRALTWSFELEGQPLIALNGGPYFTFNEAVSFFVGCADQDEVDDLWEKLCDGGTPSRCGWLKDRFGLSWQIVPVEMGALLSDPDPAKAKRVKDAMMDMIKLDLAALKRAHAG